MRREEINEALDDLDILIRRARLAIASDQFAVAAVLITQAKELAKEIDPEAVARID